MKLKNWLQVFLIFTFGHLSGQDPLVDGYALLDAQKYIEATAFFGDFLEADNKTARICHARAIGLGGDAESALELFKQLSEDYSGDFEIQLNLAEAFLWNKKPSEAIEIYNLLLKSDSLNFVANLGYANAHAALSDNDTALDYIDRAIDIDPDNSGARNSKKFMLIAKAYGFYKNGAYNRSEDWLKKVDEIEPGNSNAKEIRQLISDRMKTSILSKYAESSDRGGNGSIVKQIDASFNLTNRHRIGFTANLQDSYFKDIKAAKQQSIFISDKYLLNKTINLMVGVGFSASKSEQISLDRTLMNAGVEFFFTDNLYSKLQYSSEVHNYSVDLIESDILIRHYSWAANYMLAPKLGFYLNGLYSNQSDNNDRKLLYGSLYYSLVKDPMVRIGINYNYFGYKETRENYFSPKLYQLGECFMLIDNAQSSSKFKYKFQISFGAQKVGQGDYQSISRIEASTGYIFSNGLVASVRYLTNSAAAATAIGQYIYNEWSVSLGYNF